MKHQRLRHVNSSRVPNIEELSHAVEIQDLVFVSGQVGKGVGREVVPLTIREEFDLAFDSLETVLAEAGASMQSVVRTRCYLKNLEDFDLFNEIYRQRFSKPRPARTTVGVELVGGLRFEIDAIALKLERSVSTKEWS